MRAARLLAERVPGARLAVAPEPGWWWTHQDELLSELRGFMAAIG
jgi:hypothetical protein